jgi:hypothetical protein
MADFDSPFDTLAILAEVVSSDDEMLSLGKRKYFYPDFIILNLYSPIFSRPPLWFNCVDGCDADIVPGTVAEFAMTIRAFNYQGTGTSRHFGPKTNNIFLAFIFFLSFLCLKISLTLDILCLGEWGLAMLFCNWLPKGKVGPGLKSRLATLPGRLLKEAVARE